VLRFAVLLPLLGLVFYSFKGLANLSDLVTLCLALLIVTLFVGQQGSVRWLLFDRRLHTTPLVLSWKRALLGQLGVLVMASTYMSIVSYLDWIVVSFGVGVLLSTYAAGKLGCWQLGCCNWLERLQDKLLLPLPGVEVFITLLLLLSLVYLTISCRNPVLGVALGLGGHLVLRFGSERLRSHRLPSVLFHKQ